MHQRPEDDKSRSTAAPAPRWARPMPSRGQIPTRRHVPCRATQSCQDRITTESSSGAPFGFQHTTPIFSGRERAAGRARRAEGHARPRLVAYQADSAATSLPRHNIASACCELRCARRPISGSDPSPPASNPSRRLRGAPAWPRIVPLPRGGLAWPKGWQARWQGSRYGSRSGSAGRDCREGGIGPVEEGVGLIVRVIGFAAATAEAVAKETLGECASS